MTDTPTIRIRCATEYRAGAFKAADYGLPFPVGWHGAIKTSWPPRGMCVPVVTVTFYVKRTKTGVTVRQVVDGVAL